MPDLPPSAYQALEAQLRAAQAEVARLQAEHTRHAAQYVEAERYQQSQVRFRTVFDHSPLGHKIIDANLTIRQANAAIVNMLGLASASELLGHAILEYAHPDYAVDWSRLQEALWAHHLPWFAVETCLVRPDGGLVWCRVTSVLFPDEEGELGYTTLEDISIRRRLEVQVQHVTQALEEANQDLAASNVELQVLNEELQETNAALGQLNAELDTFVYAAAHDLRLPIVNLQGLVHELVEQLPPAARQVELVDPILGMMQESMTRFRHTLDRLADFGATHQQASLPRESVNLVAVLEEVRVELASQFAATNGQLLVNLMGHTPFWFVTKHVHSVLLNLVSNALKYRHPERDPVVHVRSYRERGQLIVSVHDNGLGLSETQQGQLFGMFKRLHPHIEGTGVGLYLVKKILDHTGGSILVDSEMGQGSRFTVTFPA